MNSRNKKQASEAVEYLMLAGTMLNKILEDKRLSKRDRQEIELIELQVALYRADLEDLMLGTWYGQDS